MCTTSLYVMQPVRRVTSAAQLVPPGQPSRANHDALSESQVRVKGVSNFGTHANRLEQPREGSFGSLETDF